MPIPSDQFAAIEENLNRLATECILAQPGRDDGLVPAYSLLGELREQCSLAPALREPIATWHATLEKLLDTAHPFDEATLSGLRGLIEWLPIAIESVKADRTVAPLGAPGPATPASGSAATVEKPAATDMLLELHLEENRELLGEFHGEAVDHLQQIEAALLALDHAPDNPEALNSIFRSFHTIKGNAGFLGLVPMQSLAHEVESLLDLARNRQLRLNAAIITEILRSRDALSAFTQQVAVALEKGQLPDKIIPVGHLIQAVKKLAAAPAVVVAGVADPGPGSTSPATPAPARNTSAR